MERNLPGDLISASATYEALSKLDDKQAFYNNIDNYGPVLRWHLGYVREKFFTSESLSPKVKQLLLALYDPENLPTGKQWATHMEGILSNYELTDSESEELLAVLSAIRNDIYEMRHDIVRITGSDLITSHVLPSFDYGIQIALMKKK